MKPPRVTERVVRENVRQCRNRFVGPGIGGDTFAAAQAETIRGEPRHYYVICAGGGSGGCACAGGDAPSERQSEIRAHWVDDERRKIFDAAKKKGPLL